MLPLAASGLVILAVPIILALVMVVVLLRAEDREDVREKARAEAEEQRRAAQMHTDAEESGSRADPGAGPTQGAPNVSGR